MLGGLQMWSAICVTLFLPIPVLILTNGWEHLRVAFEAYGETTTDLFGARGGVVGLSMTGQPHAVARYMASRDELTLRRARWLALGWTAVLLAAMLACGWAARVLYDGLANPLHAPFAIATRILPPALAAMLIAPLLAAVIAGIASPLLTIAGSVSVDLKRAASEPSLGMARAALVAVAIVATVLALYGRVDLLEQAVFAYTALGAAFGPLLLVRLSGKRIRPGSALGAMWTGFILSALFHLLPDSPGDFLERVLPFVAALGIALTGGERRRNPDRADRSEETVHDRVAI
jgi:Na+/proline symporter